MKAWVPLLLAYGALACDQAMAQIDEPDIDADCHKVASYAELGKNAYQRGDYPRAADIFRDQAAWSEFCGLDSQATATAYNNVALALMHADELLKARAYLELAPQDSKSQHNLKLLQERLAKRTPSIGPGGVYWQYAGRGVWSEVEVKPQDGRWLIVYSGYYMPQMGLYYGPNMGEFTQMLPIEHGKAVYRQREPEDVMACDVAMQFGSDGLDMHTEGDCGFGFNVRAEGHFIRVE
ncbi:tetratricopeptide repeat-containing protein [Serratia liquefaciens]|uniref:tetratricopeptide repeat protein n=1 Tax=Serratia liquefaciens TaxID=614 RepID=UPI00065FE821|nr:tetratricopeptide repeat protein [Serratia liquefaciens]AMH00748.1 tetratricopeptide repeat-containing protein [Serratia liquefaciens]HEI8955995.1 tetratricopeptide repeat protein [Serratia liquefaciens]